MPRKAPACSRTRIDHAVLPTFISLEVDVKGNPLHSVNLINQTGSRSENVAEVVNQFEWLE